MGKLIYGVGISEAGEFSRSVRTGEKTAHTREYRLWCNMLQRCYSERHRQKYPTYLGCGVSEDFKYFQRFAKWCHAQIGFGERGFQLDKDILGRGNLQYSEDTCVFVPQRINLLLIKCDAVRGDHPIGVSLTKQQKYVAHCGDDNGKRLHLGIFNTPEAAHCAYKTCKESLIKRLADEYQSVIDHRVYTALMVYTISIND